MRGVVYTELQAVVWSRHSQAKSAISCMTSHSEEVFRNRGRTVASVPTCRLGLDAKWTPAIVVWSIPVGEPGSAPRSRCSPGISWSCSLTKAGGMHISPVGLVSIASRL